MIAPPSRRGFLAGLAAALTLATGASADQLAEMIHVVKDPGCGCCGAWIEHLTSAGLASTVQEMGPEELAAYKLTMGVPPALTSCHTASMQGYVLEGHVPAADIRRLLAERPDAIGLAVPGMPYGSPGMGPEAEREAYDVMLILRDGTATVFTSYPAA